MITLKVNGKEVTVNDGTLILDAAKEAGVTIPTFCYQAKLSGLGSCRMCIIEIGGQKKLQPSCITPVIPGMEVFTHSPQVVSARAAMLEFLLSNHAFDCPVCDKAGECELQDMVFEHGPRKGSYSETKRVFHEKDYVLSPVIVKNSNRCVQCMRCVRACDEIVGRGVLGALGRGSGQEMTSFLKTQLDCDHCGMCIEVCPCGCFMRKPYRYTARPWDLKGVKSVCPYCATGCRITVEERAGTAVRSIAKEGAGFNDKLLCARGRFGFDFVNSTKRITTPLLKKNGIFEPITWEEAYSVMQRNIKTASGEKTGVIASARLTNEELYLLQKVARTTLKTANIDSASRWSEAASAAFMHAVEVSGKAVTAYGCMDQAAIFILGSQISDENPVTDYIVRIMSNARRKNIIIASPRGMKLDRSAMLTLRHAPARLGALILGVCAAIKEEGADKFAGIKGVDLLGGKTVDSLAKEAGVSSDDVKGAAKRLKASETIALMAGIDMMRNSDGINEMQLLKDMLKVLKKDVRVMPLLDRTNQRGAWDMGVHPAFGPGYSDVSSKGLGAEGLMKKAASEGLDMLYVVGEDVVASYPGAALVKEALKKIKFLVVQDVFMTETAKAADLVLPGAMFVEKNGTVTSQEGRVQRINMLRKPAGEAKDDLEIIAAIGGMAMGGAEFSSDADAVLSEIEKTVTRYSGAAAGVETTEGFLLGDSDAGQAKQASAPKMKETEIIDGAPLRPYHLVTGNHLYYSGTLTAHSKVIGSFISGPVVEMAASEAKKLGLNPGDEIEVTGAEGVKAVFSLRVNSGTRPDVVFVPENYADSPANMFFEAGIGAPRVSVAPRRK
ncbi:MAG: NADH-quinone oxidoreductase subunit NuoG [Deltaproteobacteria bacterium]|nr:NADH-quinone oxidoreductase subunit NuoG [Deltaproteobacteria bacterium]